MSDWTIINEGSITSPKGFVAQAISAGIKNPQSPKLDLALVVSQQPAVSSGFFTTNAVSAAPVRLNQSYLKNHHFQAVIVNSGNANACTGSQGDQDAVTMTNSIAEQLSLAPEQVGVCSTGVIGLPMPMQRITPALSKVTQSLSKTNGTLFAEAIMTSDTKIKQIAIQTTLSDGSTITIGGCAKGAGMIHPNMATMLAFITTDVAISAELLKELSAQALPYSFNAISIDGDMSTNDTLLVLANGASHAPTLTAESPDTIIFKQGLLKVMQHLAFSMVRDGERVTKFVTVNVVNAASESDARKIANAVATSSLVKSSWNGEDPNWGRVIHAVGYARAEQLDPNSITISYSDSSTSITPCENGLQAKIDMPTLQAIVSKTEFAIKIDLQIGEAQSTIYSSDLSPEYVDFNRSEYAYWKQAKSDGLI